MKNISLPVLSQAFMEETQQRIKKEEKRFNKKIRKLLKKLGKI